MSERSTQINRAPVLTLWAATVAERLGFNQDEALSLGKAVAGMTAQSKRRHLGIFKPVPQEMKKARAQKRGEEFSVELCGRQVPATNTKNGVRAVTKGRPVDSQSVERYLESKFGVSLGTVRSAMRDWQSLTNQRSLRTVHLGLYEEFRPEIPRGTAGWGAKGNWDIDGIRSFARESRRSGH